jgi:hypothetical protein
VEHDVDQPIINIRRNNNAAVAVLNTLGLRITSPL